MFSAAGPLTEVEPNKMNAIGVSTMNGEAITGGAADDKHGRDGLEMAAFNWRMVALLMRPGKPRESSS